MMESRRVPRTTTEVPGREFNSPCFCYGYAMARTKGGGGPGQVCCRRTTVVLYTPFLSSGGLARSPLLLCHATSSCLQSPRPHAYAKLVCALREREERTMPTHKPSVCLFRILRMLLWCCCSCVLCVCSLCKLSGSEPRSGEREGRE